MIDPSLTDQFDNLNLPESQLPKLADITAANIDAANKIASYTRVNTQELNQIISSIRHANQAT